MIITPDLKDKVALVTGASRGIGAAIAVALAQAGAAVAVNYRERADAADALVADLGKAGHRAIAIAADVSQADAVTGWSIASPRALGADRHPRQQCGPCDRARRRRSHRERFRPDHHRSISNRPFSARRP